MIPRETQDPGVHEDRDRGGANRATLAEIAALETLSTSWRSLAARRLERSAVEDWTPRLSGEG
ncbi:3-alpha domain-containing protein [Methylobacterium sp. Leaf100]|uniref:3-alpha domain-containing protein n=1 Tax=Methylobacterium sp. Leaf100 TaxID=1736252 RepID=UPI0006F89339|nr:3-alpha domain-containing protein [Methylobacterium sp. Leaf100]KQP30068.1 hypothetical protein ASF25_19550 [Methylobacterium sp. Leaf100]